MNKYDERIVAENIIIQMGGIGKIKAMVVGSKFVSSENSITFHFKGSRKMNVVMIELNGLDLYDVSFMKYSPKTLEVKIVKEFNGVYNDQLKSLFESETGLYLSL